jgi:hypothetical protein
MIQRVIRDVYVSPSLHHHLLPSNSLTMTQMATRQYTTSPGRTPSRRGLVNLPHICPVSARLYRHHAEFRPFSTDIVFPVARRQPPFHFLATCS